jgi:hypothetical protein
MVRHRLRQFATAGRLPSEADHALAREVLSGPLLALFERQHPREIVHTAATARWLIERGHTDSDLIVAALLHDVAKGEQRRLDRVAFVLASRAGAAAVLARRDSRFAVRRAVARSQRHAAESARAMAAAGASPRATALTRRHHAPAGADVMLALLQQADAAS